MDIKLSYLFGSKMLKLNNCRDEDWLTFVDVPKGREVPPQCHRIGFEKFRIKTFTDDKNSPTDYHKTYVLYQESKEFQNDENYPFNDFSILDHKKVWIKQLKNHINLESTEQWATDKDILPKQFYHILYQYHMIIEDTVWISDEAKVNVQKRHDLEMPSSYYYE